MKSIKLLATFLMLLFFAGTSFAQSLEVSGTVSDSETGETLPFAYVQIKGTIKVPQRVPRQTWMAGTR